MPDESRFNERVNRYKLFADGTRLKILWALSRESMCVCDLAVLLNMTKSAISHQLKLLRLAGMVEPSKKGKVVFYKINGSVECEE
jgi:ArsR family transcriptional regulator